MADVLTSDRVMAVLRHFGHLSDGDSHEVCLMARSHEELRARLERAEDALHALLRSSVEDNTQVVSRPVSAKALAEARAALEKSDG